jgi:hypothetical protein
MVMIIFFFLELMWNEKVMSCREATDSITTKDVGRRFPTGMGINDS